MIIGTLTRNVTQQLNFRDTVDVVLRCSSLCLVSLDLQANIIDYSNFSPFEISSLIAEYKTTIQNLFGSRNSSFSLSSTEKNQIEGVLCSLQEITKNEKGTPAQITSIIDTLLTNILSHCNISATSSWVNSTLSSSVVLILEQLISYQSFTVKELTMVEKSLLLLVGAQLPTLRCSNQLTSLVTNGNQLKLDLGKLPRTLPINRGVGNNAYISLPPIFMMGYSCVKLMTVEWPPLPFETERGISTQVASVRVGDATEPLDFASKINFPTKQIQVYFHNLTSLNSPSCVSRSDSTEDWVSNDRCILVMDGKTGFCQCDHLTDFAISDFKSTTDMGQVKTQEESQTMIPILGAAGVVGLLVTIITISVAYVWRKQRIEEEEDDVIRIEVQENPHPKRRRKRKNKKIIQIE
jgi:hypothetical protein